MEIKEKEQIKKKMKTYEKLGALKFQKIVFGVEKAKFKLLKTICPNFIKYADKFLDFQKRKAMDKATSEREADRISKEIIDKKIAIRTEFYREKNANYHMNLKKPTKMKAYLELNKQIHEYGIVFNAVVIPLAFAGAVAGLPFAIPVLTIEVVDAFINFECINIQNYNLCRFKLAEETLIKKEMRETKKKVEEYGGLAEELHKTREKKGDILSIEEVLTSAKDNEKLEQLIKLLENQQTYVEDKPKVKVRGNYNG